MLTYDALTADQHAAIAFILGGEDALLAADVGTGKTVIALTAGMSAINEGRVTRWLVLGPRLVCQDTWIKEPAQWEHLPNTCVANIAGKPSKIRRQILSNPYYCFTCCNYENLSWLVENGYLDCFDGLICDEIDKLKSVSSDRFKAFRNHIKRFKMRVGLTGTLVPNDLTELWGQVYTVDGGQSFGRSYYKWRKQHFYPTDYQQHDWQILPGELPKLIEAMSGLVYRLPAKGLPDVVIHDPAILDMEDEARRVYDVLSKKFYTEFGDDAERRIVDAVNSGVLVGKLQQICAGFSYTYAEGERPGKATPTAVWHSRRRFDWLDTLLTKTLRGEQVLIFYHFQEELDELKRQMPWVTALKDARRPVQVIADWNAGKIEHLALHPASAGHGLNLQKSGAHHIAFLTLPWSGGLMKQVVGRLARRGQSASEIYVHTALFRDTIDEAVFSKVTGRLNRLEEFLDEL